MKTLKEQAEEITEAARSILTTIWGVFFEAIEPIMPYLFYITLAAAWCFGIITIYITIKQ